MFMLDGYTSPALVMKAIAERAYTQGSLPQQIAERSAFLRREFWTFCEGRPKSYALSPTGQVFETDGHILHHRSLDDINGVFFSPRFGILGAFVRDRTTAGPMWLERPLRWLDKSVDGYFSNRIQIAYARERLGLFFGMAVLFKSDEVVRFIDMETDAKPSDEKQIKVETELTRILIDAFDRRALPNKSFAKEAYGAAISSRGFIRAWDQAANQRPNMSKRGRRSLDGD